MNNEDIRWQQRLSNYNKTLQQLEKAVALARERGLSDLEQQGLIQAFEYTHELAWKTLKDFIESRGNVQIYGSRDATREAFSLGLITEGQGWMDMIRSRNQTSHTYNEETAEEIARNITEQYFKLFKALQVKLEKLQKNDQE